MHIMKRTETREITPCVWLHPDEERQARKHRLGKCDGEQARAKQDKTGDGHSEETVRSEFFTHSTTYRWGLRL